MKIISMRLQNASYKIWKARNQILSYKCCEQNIRILNIIDDLSIKGKKWNNIIDMEEKSYTDKLKNL